MFHYVYKIGQANVAKLLIENGADVNAKNKYEKQPMHRVAEKWLNVGKSGILIKKRKFGNLFAHSDIQIANIETLVFTFLFCFPHLKMLAKKSLIY